jgi:polyphosphate glucokinase
MDDAGESSLKPMAMDFTLCVDIGGSHIKASVVDRLGRMTCSSIETPTPEPATPAGVIATVVTLASRLPLYHRISVGFPGVVRDGCILTAPNLGTRRWHGVDLAKCLETALKKPVRVLNDAEVQGLGVISGKGLECVITLGTGFGSAVFRDGQLMPHLELGQHPAWKSKTYDQFLGHAALLAKGTKRWNRRLARALGSVTVLLNFDQLYIGGGNARKVRLRLPENVTCVANKAGITGGARLWGRRFASAPGGSKERNGSLRR